MTELIAQNSGSTTTEHSQTNANEHQLNRISFVAFHCAWEKINTAESDMLPWEHSHPKRILLMGKFRV